MHHRVSIIAMATVTGGLNVAHTVKRTERSDVALGSDTSAPSYRAALHVPTAWPGSTIDARCMNIFENEIAFRAAGPAALAVVERRLTEPEISDSPWKFRCGSVSVDGQTQAWAEFVHVSSSGSMDTLAVIALKIEPGRWAVEHVITRGLS